MNEKQQLLELASDIAYAYNWVAGRCDVWEQNVLDGNIEHCCRCFLDDHQFSILFGE